jgi:hypothetical protein
MPYLGMQSMPLCNARKAIFAVTGMVKESDLYEI